MTLSAVLRGRGRSAGHTRRGPGNARGSSLESARMSPRRDPCWFARTRVAKSVVSEEGALHVPGEARRSAAESATEVQDYRHDATRLNNPEVPYSRIGDC